MDEQGLLDLLRSGEGQQVEFKRKSTAGVSQTACAFANTGGGVILVGISDDGRVVGVSPEEERRVSQRLSRLEPYPEVRVTTLTLTGKGVMVVEVEASKKLVTLGGVAYIRVGPTNRPLSINELVHKAIELALVRLDEAPSEVPVDEVDEDAVSWYLERREEVRGVRARGTPAENLRALHAVVEGSEGPLLTYAGLLFFTPRPDEHVPGASLRVIRMDTDSDNDGVNDSAEMDPFMLFKSPVGPSHPDYRQELSSKDVLLDTDDIDYDEIERIDSISGGKAYLLEEHAILKDRILSAQTSSDGSKSYSEVYKDAAIKDIAASDGGVYYTVDHVGIDGSDGIHYVDEDGLNHRMLVGIDDLTWLDIESNGRIYIVESGTTVKCYETFSGQLLDVLYVESTIDDIVTDAGSNIVFSMDRNLYLLASGFTPGAPDSNSAVKLTGYQTSGGSPDPAIGSVGVGKDGDIFFIRKTGNPTVQDIRWLKPEYDNSPPLNNYYRIQRMSHYSGYSIPDISVDMNGNLYYINRTGDSIEFAVYSKTSMTSKDSDKDRLFDGYDLADEVWGELSTHKRYSLGVHVATSEPTHPLNPDMDGDGLLDGAEVYNRTILIEDWQNALDRRLAGYLKFKILKYNTTSDPYSTDTDGDGLEDALEHGYTDPCRTDSDFDGIGDYYEDDDHDGKTESTDHNGLFDPGETCPADRDTDDDSLPDGWDDTDADGVHDQGEHDGEDLDYDGLFDFSTHPDPRIPDTDGDGVIDGFEYEYLMNLTNDRLRDSDEDGILDLLEFDSDNDGLSDGEENVDGDCYMDEFKNETVQSIDKFPTINEGCWGNYTNEESPPPIPSETNETFEQNYYVIDYYWSDGKPDQLKEFGDDVDEFEVTYEGYIFFPNQSDDTNCYILKVEYMNKDEVKFKVNYTGYQIDESTDYTEGWEIKTLTFDNEAADQEDSWIEPGYSSFEFYYKNQDGMESGVKLSWYFGDGVSKIYEVINITTMACIGDNMNEDFSYFIETNATDPDSDDDGLLDGAEPNRWLDTDGDGFINSWDQDTNDGIANVDASGRFDKSSTPGDETDDDYEEVYVVLRRDADSGPFIDYESGTWLAADPGTKDSNDFNLYISSLQLRKYSFQGYTASPPALDQLIVGYGDEIVEELPVQTPEGYNVSWVNDGTTYGDIYVHLPNSTYAIYTYSSTGLPYTNDNSVPEGGGGFIATESTVNYVRFKQEVYDARVCLNVDSDFDGIPNFVELAYGTNPYDHDTDNDGVKDGDEPHWNIDTDGDGIWQDSKLLPGFKYNDRINALDQDSDNDGILDGVEMGVTELPSNSTDNRIPTDSENNPYPWYTDGTNWTWSTPNQTDADPATTTNPLCNDTDGDGLPDGGILYWNCTVGDDGSLEWKPTDDDDYKFATLQKWQGEDLDFDGMKDPTETNATLTDTDRDGVPDGYERVFNTSNWIPMVSEGAIKLPDKDNLARFTPMNPLSHDSDGDGLYDGLEISWPLSQVVDVENATYYVVDMDPYSVTNPKDYDTDLDGINDAVEDGNKNGAREYNETNASHPDTDGDHLLDGANVQKGTINDWYTKSEYSVFYFDPEEFPDWAEEDWEPWCSYLEGGFGGQPTYYFIGEETVGTDPLNNDTDMDGLLDGTNGSSMKGEMAIHFRTSHEDLKLDPIFDDMFPIADAVVDQIRPTDPLSDDSDDDGLSDFQEVEGWDVLITYEKDERTHSKRWVMCNPWVKDSDSDTLEDYDEYLNLSDPLRIDTDGDGIFDEVETQGNLTKIEGQDPEIVGDIEAHVEITWGTFLGLPFPERILVVVTVTFKDNAGLAYVGIKISGSDWSIKYLESACTEYEYIASFEGSIGRLLFNGWDIDVKAFDINGNGVNGSTHLDGIVEGIIKAILAFLSSLWEAIKEIASKILSWLWELIKNAVNTIFKPIYNCIESFFMGLKLAIYKMVYWIFEELPDPPVDSSYVLDEFAKVINLFFGLFIVVTILDYVVWLMISASFVGEVIRKTVQMALVDLIGAMLISAMIGVPIAGLYMWGMYQLTDHLSNSSFAKTDFALALIGFIIGFSEIIFEFATGPAIGPSGKKTSKGYAMEGAGVALAMVGLLLSWLSMTLPQDEVIMALFISTAAFLAAIAGTVIVFSNDDARDEGKSPCYFFEEVMGGFSFVMAFAGILGALNNAAVWFIEETFGEDFWEEAEQY